MVPMNPASGTFWHSGLDWNAPLPPAKKGALSFDVREVTAHGLNGNTHTVRILDPSEKVDRHLLRWLSEYQVSSPPLGTPHFG